MRLAVQGRVRAPIAVAVLLVICLTLVFAAAAPVLAASPDPSAATGGDPRSSGQGPGLVGDPATAIGAVLLIALVTVGATGVYLRVTDKRQDPQDGRGQP